MDWIRLICHVVIMELPTYSSFFGHGSSQSSTRIKKQELIIIATSRRCRHKRWITDDVFFASSFLLLLISMNRSSLMSMSTPTSTLKGVKSRGDTISSSEYFFFQCQSRGVVFFGEGRKDARKATALCLSMLKNEHTYFCERGEREGEGGRERGRSASSTFTNILY